MLALGLSSGGWAVMFGDAGWDAVVAFVVSILAIKFLMSYIKKNDFKAFGYYRIVLGILVLGYFNFIA